MYKKYKKKMYKFYNPLTIETDFISNKISIKFTNNNFSIHALENIEKNTIILKEIPKYNLFNEINIDKTIQMIYYMILNKNDINIINLYPRSENINYFNSYHIKLKKIIKSFPDKKIKDFLLSHDINIIYYYYYKYLYNAFEMYNSPVLLFNAAKINHSCTPNIYFYENNNSMIFKTLKDIKKNEELTYSYLRNCTLKNKLEEHNYLKNHYNFICNC